MRNPLVFTSRFIIPTILLLLALSSYALADPAGPRVVFMIGEDEYHTWETLPEFAKTELEPRGMCVTVILEDPADHNRFPGLVEALAKTDLLVLSVRRRLPPKKQLDAVRAYLAAGKPLVGIRTACHAFAPPLNAKADALPAGADAWPEFDPQVLGGHYTNHWGVGPTTTVLLAPGAEGSPILDGVEVSRLVGNGSLYKVNPLDASCKPLLIGTIPGKPAEPLAWTREYGSHHARVFYTSLGHPDDFREPPFRRLLLNGIRWALDAPRDGAADSPRRHEGAKH